MRDRLVFTNIADRTTDEAFNTQVRQFLSFLEGRIDEVIKYGSEVGEDEIQSELGRIASEAVKEHQLRWRILDYLAFWEIDLNGSERLELIESCLLLIQTAMNGSIPSENPKLIKCVRTLFSEKPIGHAPLDLYRPVGNEIWNKDLAGYQDCVRQGTLLALSVNLHRIFVLFGLILPSPAAEQKIFPRRSDKVTVRGLWASGTFPPAQAVSEDRRWYPGASARAAHWAERSGKDGACSWICRRSIEEARGCSTIVLMRRGHLASRRSAQ